MIVCSCTGATDRDVRAGRAAIGTCKGCKPTVLAVRAELPRKWPPPGSNLDHALRFIHSRVWQEEDDMSLDKQKVKDDLVEFLNGLVGDMEECRVGEERVCDAMQTLQALLTDHRRLERRLQEREVQLEDTQRVGAKRLAHLHEMQEKLGAAETCAANFADECASMQQAMAESAMAMAELEQLREWNNDLRGSTAALTRALELVHTRVAIVRKEDY